MLPNYFISALRVDSSKIRDGVDLVHFSFPLIPVHLSTYKLINVSTDSKEVPGARLECATSPTTPYGSLISDFIGGHSSFTPHLFSLQVGGTGLEPATSSMSRKHSNQLS